VPRRKEGAPPEQLDKPTDENLFLTREEVFDFMATKTRYPTGARPLLIEETARRRRIEARFVEALEAGGFAEIVLPIIDFAEPYAGVTDRAAARQSYRFTDREGELVALRSDFTPMVARALAPVLAQQLAVGSWQLAVEPVASPSSWPGGGLLPTANCPLPTTLRVFYRGDVIRCEATRLGANRELFQIGAELIGDAGVEADIEILRLVASIVRAFGVKPLIVWNDVSLATGKAPGTATIDDVAGTRVAAIASALDPEEFVLHLDDPDDAGGYYTGLRFRVYGSDSRRTIAQGGRYDSLYARFGAAVPAIGFTFTIDELED
jgi:ATP phosphoribosyltransferase regulatory subunit